MKYTLFFILIIVVSFFFFSLIKSKKKTLILHLNMKKQPKTMDPRKEGDMYSTQMHSLFFEGLVKVYPDQSIKLAQAKSYEVSEDKLTYTFFLRDTLWSNGAPVTAYDFEQSWKDLLDPKFPSMSAQLFSPIKNADAAKKGLVSLDDVGIKATDAKTLVITLEKPTPYLFKLLSFCAFSPVNIENDRKNPDWASHAGTSFVSNGPFRLEKWDHENQIIAIRNPTYRKTEDLHPEKIIFNIVENNEITLQMFEKGLVDIIGDCLTDIPLEEIPHLEKKWTISRKPTASTVLISLNTDKPPFNHPKIRRAFSLAINREKLIGSSGKGIKKNILKYPINIAYQASSAATNMVPPCLKENRHRSFFKDNDGTQARILLEEGLIELGLTKTAFNSIVLYYYSQFPGTSELIEAIQQQWLDALDILITTECLEFRDAVDKLSSGDYSMCFMHWEAMYHDPMSVLERFKYKSYATNFSNWENSEYIKLLDRSFYEEADKRFQTLEQAEKLILNEMPVIPLYHEDYVYIINPRLPFTIPVWWGDRMLLPLSSEDKQVQSENKYAHS
ncbi:MAG: peptide ABC transporter substrate-binding protein [Verrucomicrobiota bacterium]